MNPKLINPAYTWKDDSFITSCVEAIRGHFQSNTNKLEAMYNGLLRKNGLGGYGGKYRLLSRRKRRSKE